LQKDSKILHRCTEYEKTETARQHAGMKVSRKP
jgi:hypothetical protein